MYSARVLEDSLLKEKDIYIYIYERERFSY